MVERGVLGIKLIGKSDIGIYTNGNRIRIIFMGGVFVSRSIPYFVLGLAENIFLSLKHLVS
jgi:hypothetical protein